MSWLVCIINPSKKCVMRKNELGIDMVMRIGGFSFLFFLLGCIHFIFCVGNLHLQSHFTFPFFFSFSLIVCMFVCVSFLSIPSLLLAPSCPTWLTRLVSVR